MKWYIGCSGFHYKHWKGTFYPDKLPQSKWFSFYCEYFKTLELNVTFYRFPQLSFLQGWYNKSPADFKFAVKAPRVITHYKKFNDVQTLINDFYAVTEEGLQEKLGCILFQLPPSYSYTPEHLDKILSSMSSRHKNVLEFRHPSWWNDDVKLQLATNNISFCGMSHPTLPEEVVINSPTVYYRLHGKEELYKSSYNRHRLSNLVESIKASGYAEEVYIFFNNDISLHAIYNALETRQLAQPGEALKPLIVSNVP